MAKKLEKVLNSIAEIAGWIGYSGIILMILLVLVDVIGRYILNKPLPGGLELLQLAMLILGSFAIMYTSRRNQHINVDVIFTRLPPRIQAILESIGFFLGFAIWGIIASRVFFNAITAVRVHELSEVLYWWRAPFLFIVSVALFLNCLITLIQAIYKPTPASDAEGRIEL